MATFVQDRVSIFGNGILTFFISLVALFISIGAWAIASPIDSSPDDDFHLTSIWCASGGLTGICEEDPESEISRLVSPAFVSATCFAHRPEFSAKCQITDEVFTSRQLISSERGNFAGNYPPVFYAFMHFFAFSDIQVGALVMRLVNVLLFITVGSVLFALSPMKSRSSQILIWLATLIPLGVFIIASNNPSSWAVMGVGFTFVALQSYFVSSGIRKSALALIAILTTFMAAGARADAAIYVGLVAVVTSLLNFSKSPSYLKSLWLPIATGTISLFFYFQTQQAGVAVQGFGHGIYDRSPLSVLFVNLVELPSLWLGVFGQWGLGWLDTGMPTIVWTVGAIFFSGLFLLGWQKLNKTERWIGAGTMFIAIVLPLYILQQTLAHVGEFLQPRYLLPLYVVLVGVALIGFNREALLRPLSLRVSIVIFVGFSYSISLFMNIRRYTFGANKSVGTNLDSGYEWWWPVGPTPMQTWLVGSLSFILLLCLLFFSRKSPLNNIDNLPNSENPIVSAKPLKIDV